MQYGQNMTCTNKAIFIDRWSTIKKKDYVPKILNFVFSHTSVKLSKTAYKMKTSTAFKDGKISRIEA